MANSVFPSQTKKQHEKPSSNVELVVQENIVHQWQSAINTLAQREREMINMSKQFVEHIKTARDETNLMLQANQTMLEEIRRRGLQLKKLEVFFAEFPLPHSLRQPVASAFLSVGINMPWWTAKLDPPIPEQMQSFSDTEPLDAEDLCARLRSLIEIKDQLTQTILDEQARHEAEMQSFILQHKQSVSAAHDNAILASTHWTIERLTLQSKIQEKETEIQVLNQELNLLKQRGTPSPPFFGVSKMRSRLDPQSHVILTLPKPNEANMAIEFNRPSPDYDGAMVSPRTRSVTISLPSPRASQIEIPNTTHNVNLKRWSGSHPEQAHEQQQHASRTFPNETLTFSSLNAPLSSPRLSPGDAQTKLQHQNLHDQWQKQLLLMHSKHASLHPDLQASMLRGLKGTKMHSEFRGQGEGAVGSPLSDAMDLLRTARCGKGEQSPRTVSSVGNVKSQQRDTDGLEGN
jgi:hypothetical protein